MKLNNLNQNESFFRFVVSEEIKKKLVREDFIALTEIGLPTKILSNSFIYNKQIIEDETGNLILGYNTHVNEWKLKINLIDFSVFYSGKGNLSDEVYSFYNSSIYKLILSLFIYDFFLKRLIMSNLLGEYHINYEKYADLLFELIFDIDKIAVVKGAWFSLIDEMKLGVI